MKYRKMTAVWKIELFKNNTELKAADAQTVKSIHIWVGYSSDYIAIYVSYFSIII
ncbi:MAG TPA: hypothetical protein VKZ78_00160 [Sphingobacteriaceae bacterium]|nr:hypothetical protein [Sphingobacteriaceae bacterium]